MNLSSAAPRHEPGWYEIRLRVRLDPRWSAWLDGMSLEPDTDGTTLIRGPVPDQAALHGLLAKFDVFGIPLVSVTQLDRDGTSTHTAPDSDPLNSGELT